MPRCPLLNIPSRRSFCSFDLRDRLRHALLPVIHTNVCGLPKGHRFQMKKFRGVFDVLVRDKVMEPPRASESLACLVHSPDYVRRFFSGETTKEEQRRTGFSWTQGLASRVRYETGGTVLAVQAALERGIASSTGGGTHHAGPDYGSGYCLINDLAVAAAFALNSDLAQRVLIIDLDVHQGDGTALIFRGRERVFTFSMHSEKNFPFRKQESDLDLGLEDGLGDRGYLRALENHLPDVISGFRPDLVLYDAGVDVHEKDDLGRLKLTDQGIWNRDLYVLELCKRLGIPVCTVIGGGYDKNLEVLSQRHSIILRAATKVYAA